MFNFFFEFSERAGRDMCTGSSEDAEPCEEKQTPGDHHNPPASAGDLQHVRQSSSPCSWKGENMQEMGKREKAKVRTVFSIKELSENFKKYRAILKNAAKRQIWRFDHHSRTFT